MYHYIRSEDDLQSAVFNSYVKTDVNNSSDRWLRFFDDASFDGSSKLLETVMAALSNDGAKPVFIFCTGLEAEHLAGIGN
jgi:hypothetical protein